jgi:hypothetical protein
MTDPGEKSLPEADDAQRIDPAAEPGKPAQVRMGADALLDAPERAPRREERWGVGRLRHLHRSANCLRQFATCSRTTARGSYRRATQ